MRLEALMIKPIPDPLYPCCICYEEYSRPADQLFWSEPLQDWCCDDCWEGVDEHWADEGQHFTDDTVIDYGVSLAEELKTRGLAR
jgi:hypothetical protein